MTGFEFVMEPGTELVFDGETVGVLVEWTLELESVLQVLGLSYGFGGPEPRLLVQMDGQADRVLERIADALTRLRWGYEPGRRLQLQLPLFAEVGDE